MFGANEETFKSCRDCSLLRTDNECLDNIMVGERHYIYQKITWKQQKKRKTHLKEGWKKKNIYHSN